MTELVIPIEDAVRLGLVEKTGDGYAVVTLRALVDAIVRAA